MKLELDTIESIVDNYLEIAAKDGKTTLEVLDYFIDPEKQTKENTARERKIRLAMFPVHKRLEDFDLDFQPSIDRTVISDIASLRFVHNAENLVFLGPPGVGKSHFAIAMGVEAVNTGFKMSFVNAGTLVEGLKNSNLKGILEKKLKVLGKYDLLIIDEMGYLPFDSEEAHCFFSWFQEGMRWVL